VHTEIGQLQFTIIGFILLFLYCRALLITVLAVCVV